MLSGNNYGLCSIGQYSNEQYDNNNNNNNTM